MLGANDRPSIRRGLRVPVSERKLLLGFGDVIAVNLSVLGALRIWAFVGRKSFDLAFIVSQLPWFIILSLIWLVLASANNFYDLALTARWARSQQRMLVITVQLLIIYLLIFFFSDRDALPRLFILYYAVLSYILIALWRLSRPFLIGWRPFRQRELVVGVGWAAQAIVDAIRLHAPGDYQVAGFVAEEGTHSDDVVVTTDVVGKASDLTRIVDDLRVNEIILATSGPITGELYQAVMDCYERGIPIRAMAILYEQLTGRVPVEHVGDNWHIVLPVEGRSPFDPYPALKRSIDIALSLIGLIIFGVMLPFLAAIIWLDCPGPIFYAQERVGRAGRMFRVFKLRSMVPDAEGQHGPTWAASNDKRVTRVGGLLRRSRLDEVPQLWNILNGDMSLIGPRPERPFFVEQLQKTIPFYRTRLVISPGLTGWAQVNYRYGNTEEDALIKLQYDLYYIRHRSLLLDGLIILKTVGQVVRLQGT
jgi:exopolysaccharide biosynthesis polyprenyl glycosylphosphotransferase